MDSRTRTPSDGRAVLRCLLEDQALVAQDWIDPIAEGAMLLAGPVDPGLPAEELRKLPVVGGKGRGTGILNRITCDPQQCGGRPCVRGMCIRVADVLDLLAAGLSREAILAEMPDLDADDISACIRFARRRVDHPVLAG